MVELSNERIEQILKDETKKTEEPATILRAIYTRYMNLFEHYFADLNALNDDKIDEFRKYHEETKSLIKYYYMDIPEDVCSGIKEFEEKSCDKLLGREWKKDLFDVYNKFKEESNEWDMSDDYYQAEFIKQTMKEFYENMGYIFRSGFGTESESDKKTVSGITGLLFGNKEK